MSGWNIALISIILTICWYIYMKIKKQYAYFEERNIPYVRPTFPFGSDIKNATFRSHYVEAQSRVYKQLKKHKVGGYFQYLKPVYLIADPEYITKVLRNDFSYFCDRLSGVDIKLNPLDENLFFLEGKKWKFLRQKLSPIFTTGKLRWMYEEMHKCGDTFIKHFERHDGKEVDIKDDSGCLTTDIIGSSVFGLEIDSIKNPTSDFRVVGKRTVELTLWESFVFFGRFFFPSTITTFKLKTFPDIVTKFFTSVSKESINNRKKTGFVRKDIIQLLLELKEKGSVGLEAQDQEELEQENIEPDSKIDFEITDNTLVAQCFVFFIAGYETTATTLNYCLYFLSKHPEYQERAREEVRKMKAKFDGKVEFDGLKEIPFLEMCILETLRIHASLPFLIRECAKNYTFPNGIKVEKGAVVIIPMFALHHDPDYFPDPEVFNPDRFNQQPKPGTYFPFGDGPRICIGKRFALTEIKMALARILDAYSVEKSDLTEEPVMYDPIAPLATTTKPLYIKVKKL